MSKKHALTAIIKDKRGKTLSIGRNSYVKTHPLQYKSSQAFGDETRIYLHAEIDALTKLPRNSKPHSIYVTRFNAYGEPVNAKPCKCCARMLNLFNILEIHYT